MVRNKGKKPSISLFPQYSNIKIKGCETQGFNLIWEKKKEKKREYEFRFTSNSGTLNSLKTIIDRDKMFNLSSQE